MDTRVTVHELLTGYRAGRLSRRDLLIRSAALGITATALGQLLAREATAAPLVQDEPVSGGTLREGYDLDAEKIGCPVRIVWGTEDKLLPWPTAAIRYREDWLPNADYVVLDDVGHSPQLDVPLETAQLILGFTQP